MRRRPVSEREVDRAMARIVAPYPRADVRACLEELPRTFDERGCLISKRSPVRDTHAYARKRAQLWRLFEGPVPDGFRVVRTCETVRCVSFRHVRMVTRRPDARLPRDEDLARTRAAAGEAWQLPDADASAVTERDCAFCGLSARALPNLVGLLDRDGPYRPGNVLAICRPCHAARESMGPAPFVAWLAQRRR